MADYTVPGGDLQIREELAELIEERNSIILLIMGHLQTLSSPKKRLDTNTRILYAPFEMKYEIYRFWRTVP